MSLLFLSKIDIRCRQSKVAARVSRRALIDLASAHVLS